MNCLGVGILFSKVVILKHILIQVVSGMEVVRELEKMGCQNGTTSKAIVINDCGELGPDE